MSEFSLAGATDRLFTEHDADRTDEYGFLDHARTPRLVRLDRILNEPLAWILGPPWLGKSTVATAFNEWLRLNPGALNGVEHRHALTRLGKDQPGCDVPPVWWQSWCDDAPRPAVWL